MNPYHNFVETYARFAREGKSWPLGGFPNCPKPEIAKDAPVALIFAPHPDDEVIIGGLALRLMRQAGWRIINIAVTQGSNKQRQAERWRELKACCECIGFDLEATGPCGLERVTLKTRQTDHVYWTSMVHVIVGILKKHQPKAIFFPHELDWNSAHIGTHFIVLDALKHMPENFTCHAVETEFWGQMPTPNLTVELGPVELGDLITALTFHVGEVKRNPYHLSLPAWMMDNVRRGGELVGGQGGAAPDFVFATLYRLRKWKDGALHHVYEGGRSLGMGEDPTKLFV
jgi:LmbE family N-acetylglucosaminyl deacetylase